MVPSKCCPLSAEAVRKRCAVTALSNSAAIRGACLKRCCRRRRPTTEQFAASTSNRVSTQPSPEADLLTEVLQCITAPYHPGLRVGRWRTGASHPASPPLLWARLVHRRQSTQHRGAAAGHDPEAEWVALVGVARFAVTMRASSTATALTRRPVGRWREEDRSGRASGTTRRAADAPLGTRHRRGMCGRIPFGADVGLAGVEALPSRHRARRCGPAPTRPARPPSQGRLRGVHPVSCVSKLRLTKQAPTGMRPRRAATRETRFGAPRHAPETPRAYPSCACPTRTGPGRSRHRISGDRP